MREDALWVKPQTDITIIEDDPADNMFLSCVYESKSDYLITGNIKHFPLGMFEMTRIVTPQEFINHIAPTFFK